MLHKSCCGDGTSLQMSVVCRVSTGTPSLSKTVSLASQAILKCPRPRASAAATLDRYMTIRSYFRNSHPAPSKSNQTSSPRHVMCTMRGISLRYQCHLASDRLSRAFHTTSHLQTEDRPHSSPDEQASRKAQTESNPNLENYSSFFRRLAMSVPHLHRPTKDDLLNVTTGFWQRARVRFKWFTIKSFRRWNADDISAFFTWFLMTQTVWILVGT